KRDLHLKAGKVAACMPPGPQLKQQRKQLKNTRSRKPVRKSASRVIARILRLVVVGVVVAIASAPRNQRRPLKLKRRFRLSWLKSRRRKRLWRLLPRSPPFRLRAPMDVHTAR